MGETTMKVTWKEIRERGWHRPDARFGLKKAVRWVERVILRIPEASLAWWFANGCPDVTLGDLRAATPAEPSGPPTLVLTLVPLVRPQNSISS
jgi:hypothetical protein